MDNLLTAAGLRPASPTSGGAGAKKKKRLMLNLTKHSFHHGPCTLLTLLALSGAPEFESMLRSADQPTQAVAGRRSRHHCGLNESAGLRSCHALERVPRAYRQRLCGSSSVRRNRAVLRSGREQLLVAYSSPAPCHVLDANGRQPVVGSERCCICAQDSLSAGSPDHTKWRFGSASSDPYRLNL